MELNNSALVERIAPAAVGQIFEHRFTLFAVHHGVQIT